MPRIALAMPFAAAALAIATLALAGCTPAPEPTAPSTSVPSTVPQGPVGPVVPVAASCLSGALIQGATGEDVTAATTDGTPPAGPIDGALAGTARTLCTYDLADGSRVGFTPLTPVADIETVDAAIAEIVGHDDCTLASGYLLTGQDTYYVFTGNGFAAAYILAGDPTDPDAWLAKIVDAAGLCGGSDSGL
ncbi:hypothetical protein BH11ACT3_BH11ACT3_12360 [soil metagenome]